ncbi:MAG: glycoside hydrolase family 127 protein [Lentisphaeria bacterium]|nr:glycoside hydrolase family 127 protein [Lentisphaeria bacterium]
MNSENKKLEINQVRMNGPLGKALTVSVSNRLKKINYTELVDPFRFRSETDFKWRCEFWGKIVRSAILAWKYAPDDELLAIIKATVKDIISTQTPDGCISSYPADKQLGGWDVWGRKYVLAGLLRYYEVIEKSPEVLNACCKMTDHLLSQIGNGNIVDMGEHFGLASASILKYIVKLYKYSGNRKYLESAEKIIAAGATHLHNIFEDAADDVLPAELANGKAYEMTSCFEGLAEYYNLFPEDKHLQAILNYYKNVRDNEIYITGTGGFKDFNGEFWYNGAWRQTWLHGGGMGETCVTTTWLHYCQYILELTADSAVADEMELSAYNALLGAMKVDGTNWIHRNPTPLAAPAFKIASKPQMDDFGDHDCCLAQGPEGLATAVNSAFSAKDKLFVNFYEDAEIDFSVQNCNVSMTISGNYPSQNSVKIKFAADAKAYFTLALRIPAWSENTVVKLNGKTFTPEKGKYFELAEKWSSESEIEIIFDMKLQKITAPGNADFHAFKYGPFVLAHDSRDAEVLRSKSLFMTETDGINFCDYATSGNDFSPENTLQVWFE